MGMPVTFHNRAAAFLWGFAVLWIGMLAAATHATLRDGPPGGFTVAATATVAAVFWAAGIGLALFAASRPCCLVRVHPGSRVSVTWRYPHRVVRTVIPISQVEAASVVDSRDSEGDPYYFARSAILGGPPIDFAESHTRGVCEQACSRFNEALSGGGVAQQVTGPGSR